MGMTTNTNPANIAQISAWSGPHYTGAYRLDIELRTPATHREAQQIATDLIERQGFDRNGIVFITR